MTKVKTQKYKIIRAGVCLKGTHEEKLGEVVDLTKEKALSMIGKVQLLEDYEAANKSSGDLFKALEATTKELKAMTAERDELAKALESMTATPVSKK